MADNRNFAALDWLIHEISETLKEARQSLESYVENPKDAARIRFCLTHIHQVHGSLQMVEFYGAALLAEEMEQLAQALLENRVSNQGEALEVLMQAILQLPVYLDRIQTARRDLPMVVLPLLNDLRAARGEKLLSETSLFSPDMSVRQPALPEGGELPPVLLKSKYGIETIYDGCSYPGVQCKLYYDTEQDRRQVLRAKTRRVARSHQRIEIRGSSSSLLSENDRSVRRSRSARQGNGCGNRHGTPKRHGFQSPESS